MTQSVSISGTVMTFIFIGLGMTTLFPAAIALYLGVRKKLSVMPFFVGALAFFVSQILLRIPLLSFLGSFPWYAQAVANPIIAAVVVGGLSAGLFEESARLLGARVFCRRRLEWRDALSFGLGHGLCEVVMLLGLGYMNTAILAVLLNAGALDTLEALAPGMAATVAEQLGALSVSNILIGLGERIPAVMYHVFATTLVFLGVRRHKAGWYWLAVLLHTALNSGAVLLASWGIWATECFTWLFGAALFFLLPQVKKRFVARGGFSAPEEENQG
ncbi:MAG: YhfC family glutamic-type intramembrane protease [Oscillospiraceae bacterium]|nr:YhfC family glutamic-type intramembrane protease [Oscillospiraceae bacterium]